MELKNAVAVVTGANRGFGRHLAAQLVERGAKVYGAARRPETVDVPGVIPLLLDVTDEASIREATRVASDTTLLINNAGISTGATLLGGDMTEVRRDMETNYFGPLATTRSFAPVIEANGGGAVLNVLSALSWFHPAGLGSYAASKAAAWALTGATRDELAPAESPSRRCTSATWTPTWLPMCPPTRRSTPAKSQPRPCTASRPACPRSSPTRPAGTSSRVWPRHPNRTRTDASPLTPARPAPTSS